MNTKTIKRILALLTALCLVMSPLGAAAVRADEPAGQEAQSAETEDAEPESTENESGSEAAAQGEDAAEGVSEEAEEITADQKEPTSVDAVPEDTTADPSEGDSNDADAGQKAPEESEEQAPEQTEPTEQVREEAAEEAAEESDEVEEMIVEEPAAEETEEAEQEEEYAEVQWPEESNPYQYSGSGLLSTLSTELKPREILSRRVVKIRSAIDEDYVLDVKGAGVANSTVVHLYEDNGTDAQKFILEENSDGTVTLVSYMCGKVLDIRGNSSSNGAQVQIYESNGTSAQKFKMIKNSDGTVTLKHSTNGKVIDISGAKAVNGRKVQLYTSNGTKAQKFYLDEKTEYYYDYSGNDWLIRSRINSASVLNVASSSKSDSGNIELNSTTRANNQRFTIEPVGAYYRIINKNSKKVIDVKAAKAANGTNIQQYTWNGTRAQLWKIQINSDGSATLVSALSSDTATRVLDVKSAKTANGTNVHLYTSNGTNAQKFFIVNADLDWDAVHTTNTGKKVSTSTENQIVLSKIIGAVESGGQNYESGLNYSAYAPPYKSTSKEYTITLGWAQHYGEDARTLLSMIREKMNQKKANSFRTDYDKAGQIEDMLKLSGEQWLKYENPNVINTSYANGRNYGWDPSQYYYRDADGKIMTKNGVKLTLKDLIVQLITTQIGRDCQDELFFKKMKESVEYCEKTYTTDVRAVMMYCQIRHLGGKSAAERIFKRINGVYSVDSIMASLALDRLDTSSSNQVGDDKFWSRHEKCKEFVQKYAIP